MAIVGYMGSGKTTIGRLVAAGLKWEFVDLDSAVVKRAGLAIPEIFEQFGEPYFREIEREVLLSALEGTPEQVISCGGGVVVDPHNREQLLNVKTVFLYEDLQVMYRRTRRGRRPLRGANYEAFARRYIERLPYYMEVAELEVEAAGRRPESVAREVIDWIQG